MRCSKCGSEKFKKFSCEASGGGHIEGYRCENCGKVKESWYVASDKEKLASNISYHFVEKMKKDEF